MYKRIFKWFTSGNKVSPQLYRAQEIWWCAIDGVEQPVLVFRKLAHHTFWGLPLVSHVRGLHVIPHGTHALSQMRILDSQRLVRRLGKMSGKQFSGLNTRVMLSLHETDPLRRRISARPAAHRVSQPTLPVRHVHRASLFPRTYVLKPAL